MATWSALSFGGIDPIGTIWENNQNRKQSRYGAELSTEQQKELDKFEAQLDYNMDFLRASELDPYAYSQQLGAQLGNYGKERQLTANRTYDSVANMRGALEASGYNPLLAVDNVAGVQAASPLFGHSYQHSSHSNAHGVNPAVSTSHSAFGAATPFDWSNAYKQGKILDATKNEIDSRTALNKATAQKVAQDTDEIMSRTQLNNATASKVRKEVELVGYENPTRALKSVADSFERRADDAEPVNSAKTFIDSVDTLLKGDTPKERIHVHSPNLMNKIQQYPEAFDYYLKTGKIPDLRKYRKEKE